jgi:hypothetical protein
MRIGGGLVVLTLVRSPAALYKTSRFYLVYLTWLLGAMLVRFSHYAEELELDQVAEEK